MNKVRANLEEQFYKNDYEQLVYYPKFPVIFKLNNYRSVKSYLTYFSDDGVTCFTGSKFMKVGYSRIEYIYFEKE